MPSAQADRRELKGYCTLCKSRCGNINVVEGDRLIAVRPDPGHPTGKALCPKGRAAPDLVHSTERLLHPMRRTNPKTSADPGWVRVSWDEALADIARRMNAVRARYGAEAVAFSTTTASGSSIWDNKAWLERFAWSFGSPNMGSSAELCDHHVNAHAITTGRSVSNPDFARTDLAVMWGHNPTSVWLAAADALGDARRRGAGLVVVDPRRTALAAQADLWLRVHPGADGILALAVAGRMLDIGGQDEDFVRRWTNAPFLVRRDNGRLLRAGELWGEGAEGFVVWRDGGPFPYDPRQAAPAGEAARFALEGEVRIATASGYIDAEPAFAIFRRATRALPLADAAEAAGVPPGQIEAFSERLVAAPSVCYYLWTGVGQHANATQIDRAIATLFALKGQFDAPGGNVAFAKPPTNQIADHGLLGPEQRAKALGVAEFPLGSARKCWVTAGDLYRAMLHAEPYPVRALIAFGSNPLASRAEPELGRRALASLDLQVHCDYFANPTAQTADYILPAATPWERESVQVGFDSSREAQSLVQWRPAIVPQQGDGRSDFWIAAELAKRTGGGHFLFDGDWEAAADYYLEPTGLTIAKLRTRPEGVSVETPSPYGRYAEQGADGVRGFDTETRRLELYSEALLRLGQPPVPTALGPALALSHEFPLRLTGAKHGHFRHSQDRHTAALRRRTPRPVFTLSPAAAEARGIADGDPVEIRTPSGRIQALCGVDPHLADNVVFGDYGWWQACEDLGEPGYPLFGPESANYNALITRAKRDPVSNTPAVKSSPCQVSRRPGAPRRWTGLAPLTVAAVRRLTADVTLIVLRRPDGAALPGFRAGQFISVQPAGQSLSRSYSLVGPPEESPRRYAIAVKADPQWRVSPYMAILRPGDEIAASAPAGRFTLPLRHSRPVVFLAFGIGITPFMSQISGLRRVADGAETYLHHSAPGPADQPFRRRLLRHARLLPNFTLTSWFTALHAEEVPPDGRADRFRVDALPQSLIDRRARFYLCGTRTAVRGTRAQLIARGVPAFEIFEERFVSPGRTPLAESGGPHIIRLARSGREVAWTGETSILDTLEGAGVPAPSGCRVGQCESCALRVIEGEVCYPETPDGLDEGVCLSCVGVPGTDIVLDL